MKKKIKDLTPQECEKICWKYDFCDTSCPLFATNKCVEYSDGRYEKEVEISESNTENN